jgi:hypothetical protein
MRVERKKALLIALILLNAAVPFTAPPAIIRAASSFIHLYFLPGLAFVLLFGNPHRQALDNLLLPLLLSPVLVAISVVGLDLIGLPFDAAVGLSLGLFNMVLLLIVIGGKGSPSTGETAHMHSSGWWIILTPLAFAATLSVLYAANNFLLMQEDAWTHACYISEILDRGLPPMEPCLPDVPLRYMWFYHLFIASFMHTSGIDLFWSMGIFNIVVAFCFPLLVARITALLTDRVEHIALVPLFAIAGLESPLWIMWPLNLLRTYFGDVKDSAEIARVLGKVQLNSPHVIQSLRSQWTWMVNLVDKFITITVFGYTLELFILAVLAVLTLGRERAARVRSMIYLVAVFVGTLAFHVVTGIALVSSLLGMVFLYILYERLRNHRSIRYEIRVIVPVSAIIAFLVLLPYIRSLLGSGSGEVSLRDYFNFGTTSFITIIAPLIILFPFARRALRQAIAIGDEKYKILGAWILALFAECILIDLPGVNESKLIFPLFALLIITIAPQLIDSAFDARTRGRTIAIVAILFLVPPTLTIRGFILAKPVREEYVRRGSIDGEDRLLFRWIENNTDPDAVMIERNVYRLMPVLAHRRNFFPNEQVIVTAGYGSDKIDRYREIRDRIFSNERITPADIDFLAGIGMPFYVVAWRNDFNDIPGLEKKLDEQSALFEKVYERPRATIYRIETGNDVPAE